VRDATGQPDGPAGQKIVFFAARSKSEFTGKNVVPLVFAVMDVLEKSPGVSVDKDGNISLKGKQGVTIMIDNRPTYMTGAQLAVYLKSLPSSAIDQLEIMSNPSAKYDAAGNSGIINIKTNLPFVLSALAADQLADKVMILMALGTIRAETGNFRPISEGISRFNTSPGGHPFNLYDNRSDLGNKGAPDGASFKGRGFVQLTGRANYTKYSSSIGLGTTLVTQPDLANDPKIASQLLARFLKDKESAIRLAFANNDLKEARRLVNGGSNGLADFTNAVQIGEQIISI